MGRQGNPRLDAGFRSHHGADGPLALQLSAALTVARLDRPESIVRSGQMGPQGARSKSASEMTLSDRADALEEQMMHELDKIITTKSVFANLGDGEVTIEDSMALLEKHPGKHFNMGPDPRLPRMTDQRTLLDYFK